MINWTEEQRLLAKTVEDMARTELASRAEELDEKEAFNTEGFKKIAELGLLGITVDEKYGGSNLGCTEATLVMEKLGEACASTALSYLAHTILCVNNISENANEDQKSRYLPKLVSGEWVGGMGMSEPGAGSDMLSMMTRAEKKGDKYILNGTKMWITNGSLGDAFVIYAKTGPSKKEISTFIVEKSFAGFSVGKKIKKFGMRASPTTELIFENCEVPIENLVGQENDSASHMKKNLNMERLTISGISLGCAQATLDYVIGYAKERRMFGKTLAEFDVSQHKLAEMATQIEAGRALTYQATAEYDRGERNNMSLGAKAKLFTAQMATAVGVEGIQMLGGYGYSKEYPVERYMRDAKLMEIGAGTNEIMRMLIARDLLELGR